MREHPSAAPPPVVEGNKKDPSLFAKIKRKGKEAALVVGAASALSGAPKPAEARPREPRAEDAAAAIDRMEMGDTVENRTEHQELNRRLIQLRDRLRGLGVDVRKITLRQARSERQVDLHVNRVLMQNPDRPVLSDSDIRPPPAAERLYDSPREREAYLSSHRTDVPFTTSSEFPELYAEASVEIIVDFSQQDRGSGSCAGKGDARRVPPIRVGGGNDWSRAKQNALISAFDDAEASIIRTFLHGNFSE